MSNILFIQASTYYPEVEKTQPLGLMYLTAALRAWRGHNPRIVDMKVDGKSTEQVLEEYRNWPTRIVGLSTITYDAKVMHEVARGLKMINPDVITIAGGAHPTAYPEEVLREGGIDYVVISEGEVTLTELIDVLEQHGDVSQVKGIAYLKDGTYVRTPPREFIMDLDSLPFPAWDLIKVEDYFNIPRMGIIFAHKEYMTLLTSRGCPYQCAYCHQTLGKVYRARSAENVLEEIRILVNRYGIKEIVVMDDMFNLKRDRVQAIARAIIDSGLKIKISFPNGFRGDIMDEDSIRLLKKAGMYRCMYAIETASPRLQKLLKKYVHLEKTRDIAQKTADMGILVHGVFMLGLPTETEEEMRMTLAFARTSPFHTAAFFRAVPFKNSGLVQLAKEDGIQFDEQLEKYEFHKTDMNLSRVPTKVVRRLKRKAYRDFYLSPTRMYRLMRLLPNKRKLLPTLFKQFVLKAFVF